MIGSLSGLTVRIKEVVPECEATHCVIHREMLASRKISPGLHSVFHDIVKMINLIKAHVVNTRLFEHLCEGMDAEHHRRSQGGQRGHGPPKFLENIVIFCFERCLSKQNNVIRLKSNILLPTQISGMATPLLATLRLPTFLLPKAKITLQLPK